MKVVGPDGQVVATADLGYVLARAVIEYESIEFHGLPGAVPRDLARANAIVAAGWTLLLATAHDLAPSATAFYRSLAEVLRRSGAYPHLL